MRVTTIEKRIFDLALWLIAASILAALVASCSPLEQNGTGTVTPGPSPSATAESLFNRQEQTTPTPPANTCTVTAYTLNLREGAGMRYAVKQILELGESVTVLHRAGAWLFVSTRESAGYIHSHYCEEE